MMLVLQHICHQEIEIGTVLLEFSSSTAAATKKKKQKNKKTLKFQLSFNAQNWSKLL